ncbi:MAG: DUF998 domain-containing protein [Thermoplasmata archaeon]
MKLKKAELYLGILAPVYSLMLVFISAEISPGFSWVNNYLSDIGGGRFGPLPQELFNLALITGGLLLILFSIVLIMNNRGKIILSISSIVIMLASISFMLIGVFTEGSPLHYPVSMGFFLLMPVAIIIASVHYYGKNNAFMAFSIFMAVISILVIMELPLGMGKAIPEYVEALLLSIWIIAFVIFRNDGKILNRIVK